MNTGQYTLGRTSCVTATVLSMLHALISFMLSGDSMYSIPILDMGNTKHQQIG